MYHFDRSLHSIDTIGILFLLKILFSPSPSVTPYFLPNSLLCFLRLLWGILLSFLLFWLPNVTGSPSFMLNCIFSISFNYHQYGNDMQIYVSTWIFPLCSTPYTWLRHLICMLQSPSFPLSPLNPDRSRLVPFTSSVSFCKLFNYLCHSFITHRMEIIEYIFHWVIVRIE